VKSFICEWCHQFFTPKYRPSKKRNGDKPRFCNTSCSAYWRMSRPWFVCKLSTDKSRQAQRESMLEIRSRPEVQEKLNRYLHSTSNPFRWLAAQYRAANQSDTIGSRKGQDYSHLIGGNGRGLSESQLMLQERLGWATEYCISIKPCRPGYPTHYKVDLADPRLKIAVEVDGNSHRAHAVRQAQGCILTVSRLACASVPEQRGDNESGPSSLGDQGSYTSYNTETGSNSTICLLVLKLSKMQKRARRRARRADADRPSRH